MLPVGPAVPAAGGAFPAAMAAPPTALIPLMPPII
jgi:hypothetical protein